jgi:hypothetical protein
MHLYHSLRTANVSAYKPRHAVAVADEEDDEIMLDPAGRVPVAGEVDYSFRSLPTAFTVDSTALAQLTQDCKTAFRVRAAESSHR